MRGEQNCFVLPLHQFFSQQRAQRFGGEYVHAFGGFVEEDHFGIVQQGAGKTTLIRILSTLVIPSSGTARVHDLDVVRHADKVRSQIGLVFSNENSFYGRLSGRQNLEFFAALHNLGWKQSRRRAADLLALFDLSGAADSAVQSYSTGMRQRLNVARALQIGRASCRERV